MAGEEPLLLAVLIKLHHFNTCRNSERILNPRTHPEPLVGLVQHSSQPRNKKHSDHPVVKASNQENVQLMAGRETVDAHGWHAQ